MTALIRTARLTGDPLVLGHRPHASVPAGGTDSLRPGIELVQIDAAEGLAPELPEIPPPQPYAEAINAGPTERDVVDEPETLTFEAFEERLAADIARRQEEARNEGYASGREAGHEAGRSEIHAELAERVARFDAMFEAMRTESDKALEATLDAAVEVVFEAVTRILGQQLVDRAGTTAAVREAIRHCKDRTKLVARVAPSDYQLICEHRDGLVEQANGGAIEIVPDDIVELGGCVLETPAGSLDARLEIQIQRLRETLVNARHKSHDTGD